MQININLSESTVNQLHNLPDPDSFVEEALKKALQSQAIPKSKPSKWALLAQDIEKNNYFDGCSEQIKKDAQEVREGFNFSSDD